MGYIFWCDRGIVYNFTNPEFYTELTQRTYLPLTTDHIPCQSQPGK